MSESPTRIVFVGDASVGKTSIIHRVEFGSFDGAMDPTIGAGVHAISRRIRGVTHEFHLWDTAGQETYRSIVPFYFKNAAVAVVVFSLTDAASFRHLPEWITLLRNHITGTVPIVIVGNKCDDPASDDLCTEARGWCEVQGHQLFVTSALTGEGIQQMIEKATEASVRFTTLSGDFAELQGGDGKGGCC